MFSGLHSTGSVFVSSIDSSNSSIFFWGSNTPFKAVLITETSVTPQWFKTLASKHHGISAFGEARCTDAKFMNMLGISRFEALPVCLVATAYPEAVTFHMNLAHVNREDMCIWAPRHIPSAIMMI
jgi:hypothetical protein